MQPLRHALVLAAVVVVVAVVKYLHSIVEKVYTCTSRQPAVRPFRGCCCCHDGGRCGRLLHAYLLCLFRTLSATLCFRLPNVIASALADPVIIAVIVVFVVRVLDEQRIYIFLR